MLQIGDWSFPLHPESSRLWLSPKGTFGLELVCVETQVATDDGLKAEFAPRLVLRDLDFDGLDWRELVGLEVYQHGPWLGEGEPLASLFVAEDTDLADTKLRIVGHRVAKDSVFIALELEATADVFVDDAHDKDVPVRFSGEVPLTGVRFRFRAEGAASRAPARRATELLALHLAPSAFSAPEIQKIEPGIFEAFFAPSLDDPDPPTRELALPEDDDAEQLSPEQAVLRQSARELLDAMIRQGWVELEDGAAIDAMVPGLVDVLEEGRGGGRAARVSEWLMDRDEVADLHVLDEELAPVLDKFW